MIYAIIESMTARKKSSWGGARPGAGRPALDRKLHRRSVDFDEADDRLLQEIAEERGISVVEVIRKAVTGYLKRQRTSRKKR